MTSAYQRRVRVHYPVGDGRLVLRTEHDWGRDLEPVDRGSLWADFEVQGGRSWLEYKPCLHREGGFFWSQGTNKLALLTGGGVIHVYPQFFGGLGGRISRVVGVPSAVLGRAVEVRLYLPAGYDENVLKRYPVLYMHDGRNLFFPEEAFLGREWQVDETLDRLDSMNLIDQTIVVGVHTGDRVRDYTQPGYESFGRALVEDVRPWVDSRLRTLSGPENTGAMGSSLGGVLAFYLAWQWPDVFGRAACLSSTFWYENDLIDRVLSEPLESRGRLRLYLDSGWPRDNYEATRAMANALLARGMALGAQVVYFAFPLATHDEGAWSTRLHLPMQSFSGKLRRRDWRV